MTQQADILIVGAGMVGTAAACLFAKSGFNIVLAESGPAHDWQPSSAISRVSALNLASRNILSSVGHGQKSKCSALHLLSG